MIVSREGLATVGNKRVKLSGDNAGLVVADTLTEAMLIEILTELRRIRLGMQLFTNDELTITDAEERT